MKMAERLGFIPPFQRDSELQLAVASRAFDGKLVALELADFELNDGRFGVQLHSEGAHGGHWTMDDRPAQTEHAYGVARCGPMISLDLLPPWYHHDHCRPSQLNGDLINNTSLTGHRGDLVDLVLSSGSATIYPSNDAILSVLQGEVSPGPAPHTCGREKPRRRQPLQIAGQRQQYFCEGV